jgi:hypothetical protein
MATGTGIAAGATASWNMTNSACASTDTATICMTGGGTITNYQFWAQPTAGVLVGYLKNLSGGTLNDPIVFNYAIIKGVNS